MIFRYLSRSILRRPLRHFFLFWTIACAFLLPLVASTYRDSLMYGMKLQDQDTHKGYAIHIMDAAPEDLELFRNIDGLTDPVYEDGRIYINFESDDFWKKASDTEFANSMSTEEWDIYLAEEQRIFDAIDSAVSKSAQRLQYVMYPYEWVKDTGKDPVMEALMQEILYLNIALLLFSGTIVFSAYRNHIVSFTQETAVLRGLGATKGQITRLFLAEFAAVFSLAAAAALGLSWIVMGYLYEHFLGNTAGSVAIWEVFRMDPKTTALELLFYFLVCLCALAVSLLRRPRSKKYRKPRAAATSLSALWIRRTKPPIVRCMLILIPLVTAFVLLFSRYQSIYAQNAFKTEDARVVVTSGELGFTEEDLRVIDELGGSKNVEKFKDIRELFDLISSDGRSETVALRSYHEHAPHMPPLLENEILVDLPEGSLALGKCVLQKMLDRQWKMNIELTRLIPDGIENRGAARAFISEELMEKLTKDTPINRAHIYTSPKKAEALELELRERLSKACNVSNVQNAYNANAKRQEGRLILLSWIFCVLMLVSSQIIWVRLASYVYDCGPMLKTLYQMGGSRQQLAGLIPVWFGAACAAVLPYLIGITWAWKESAKVERPFFVSGLAICIYAGVIVITVAVFWLPVRSTLRRILEIKQ